MPRAAFTYELPPAAGDAVWLEEYLVYDCDGEPAGKVFAVLEHDGRRLLGIERSPLPLGDDRRAVPLEEIRELDHENLAVHLDLDAGALDEALELPPEQGVEQGGEARRVVDVPPPRLPGARDAGARDAGAPGPVDRAAVVGAPAVLLAGVLTLLGAIALYGAKPSPARISWFAIPIAFFAIAGFIALRAWALPWRPDAAARRHRPPRA